MRLIVSNHKTGEINWVLEADHITIQKINEHDAVFYLRHKAFVQVFSHNYGKHLGTLYIDYGSKWELQEDDNDD